MKHMLIIACCAVLLGGCGEREQTKASDNTRGRDTPPWQGAKNAYVAPGWAAGSESAWATQIQKRNQYQNEYVKAE